MLDGTFPGILPNSPSRQTVSSGGLVETEKCAKLERTKRTQSNPTQRTQKPSPCSANAVRARNDVIAGDETNPTPTDARVVGRARFPFTAPPGKLRPHDSGPDDCRMP